MTIEELQTLQLTWGDIKKMNFTWNDLQLGKLEFVAKYLDQPNIHPEMREKLIAWCHDQIADDPNLAPILNKKPTPRSIFDYIRKINEFGTLAKTVHFLYQLFKEYYS